MKSNNYGIDLSQESVMNAFWKSVAGKKTIKTGNLEYIRPLNYKTNEKNVVVDESLPLLNLKNNNLPEFEKALTEYVREYFSSELYWANPIASCNSNEEKLIHAISSLWLNATVEDFENPIQFVRRYTNFIKDKTFEEFTEPKKLNRIQTLRNCTLVIERAEQEEFQETPTSMRFYVVKDGIEKSLPKISYGISDNVAYVYAIQGYREEEQQKKSPTMKKINRSRYAVNNTDNIPKDYQKVFLKQEPYAYISLFTFLSMLKQKGIKKVVMPSFLPTRYANKSGTAFEKLMKEIESIPPDLPDGTKRKKQIIKEYRQKATDLQRIQYTITNKFLNYASRMECDVPGISISAVPEETNGSLVMDISKMSPSEDANVIFYEIFKKVEGLMTEKNKTEEER